MTTQVIPITNLAQTGFTPDMPAVAIPPNAFSDVMNVRFRHGSAIKMPGNEELTGFTGDTITGDFIYLAWWPNPNLSPDNGYYVFITNDGSEDIVYASIASTLNTKELGRFDTGGKWQHTLFSGGFAFVLNNGMRRPLYMLDADGNNNVADLNLHELPGWDSYIPYETLIDITFDGNTDEGDFDLGLKVDFGINEVVVRVYEDDGITIKIDETVTSNGTDDDGNVTTADDAESNTTIVTPTQTGDNGMMTNDIVRIYLRARNTASVRAGVIRAFGDLLVAGNLTEVDSTDNSNIIRRLPGVIRTSDVAPAGTMPTNWNPFKTGTGTADEILLTSAGVIQDMEQMQGAMMIYTNRSIHSLQPTQNPTVPFATQTITNVYGAQSIEAIQEFDGQHLVIGSNDIYTFGGHPGSIKSIAEGRVRDFFFEDNKENDVYTVRNSAKDEIWVCYADTSGGNINKSLIWNYRTDVWTVRQIEDMISGDVAPMKISGGVNPNQLKPIFITENKLYYADESYTQTNDTSIYESYLERDRLALQPEFNTERIDGVAFWMEIDSDTDVTFQLGTTNAVDMATEFTKSYTFNAKTQYKMDARINGRFLNYRFTDTGSNTGGWVLAGMQLEVGAGGRR